MGNFVRVRTFFESGRARRNKGITDTFLATQSGKMIILDHIFSHQADNKLVNIFSNCVPGLKHDN